MNHAVLSRLDGVLVINVKRYTERRAHVERELARVGIEHYAFIHDFDIPDITPEIDRTWCRGDRLNPGQKSCALKHVAALQQVVARGGSRCLILEDDVVLSADFEQGLARALEEAPRHPAPQVVFIGSGGNFYTPARQRRPGQFLYPARHGRFTDSYLIGADAAALRLGWIESHGIDAPIDNLFDRMDAELGITLLWLEDPVVEQGSKLGVFRSTLEKSPPRPIQWLKFGWEKIRRKYLYRWLRLK
jgi:glycosyl transferase family 25